MAVLQIAHSKPH